MVPQSNLAWNFNGTTTDYIEGLTGTTTGTVSYNPSGKYGQSLVITNTAGLVAANYVSYVTPYYPSTLTLSVWVKFNTISVDSQYFFELSGTSGGLSYVISLSLTNFITLRTQSAGGVAISCPASVASLANQWYHITAVIDGSFQYLYINGVLVGGPVACNTVGLQYRNPRLGGSTSLPRILVDGELDDLRIFGSVLTADQIKGLYSQNGMPGRSVLTGQNTAATVPTVSGYTYIPFRALPSSFTLTQTTTSNAWTYSGAAITDGGVNPTLTLVADVPSDLYSTVNPGAWCRLGRQGGTNQYVRHGGYVMSLNSYTASNFDFAWAFYLKNGTTNQVKIWNPFPGNGVGYWVQSGIQSAGRIAISTTNSALAHVYEMSTPSSPYSLLPMSFTGTPIFSQLSSAAASSAVGAFSLRAVNATSAMAVQVRSGTTNATQDFWADRLGNLLTTPVSGQTLVNWLGGATGYVTIWYDQSGKGNHMSCSSTGIQPKIDLTNAWLDFKTSAHFDTSSNPGSGPVPYSNTMNYTIICHHNTIGNNNGGICGSSNAVPKYNTQNFTNNFRRAGGAYQSYWFGNDQTSGTYTTGNKVTFKWDGTNRYIYGNGALQATSPSSNWWQTSSSGQMIGRTTSDVTMNGEMYSIFMFNTSLSDSDRVLVENFS